MRCPVPVQVVAMVVAGSVCGCTPAEGVAAKALRSGGGGGAGWTTAYKPGLRDANGLHMGGTELRALVPFDGKLYAGIGYWKDSAEGDPATPGAQVLALDRADGPWRVDLGLDDVVQGGRNAGKRRHFTIGALQALALTTDAGGVSLAQPARFLAAGPWAHVPSVDVFVRGPEGPWVKTTLGRAQGNVRSFGQHLDRRTGVSRAFAGSEPLGIQSGTYDPARRTIAWETAPEPWFRSGDRDDSPLEGWRVMAFAECGNRLYATAGPALYERTDGPSPAWKKVYTADFPEDINMRGNGGLRGLASIKSPDGPGEVLLVAAGGREARVLRIDPNRGFAAIVDVDVLALLSRASQTPVDGALLAYDQMTAVSDPRTGEPALLLGVQAWSRGDTGGRIPRWYRFDARARYLVRHADGSYDVRHMEDPRLSSPPPRVAVRTLAVSPFDPGVLYAGGFDANQHAVHDTAWALCGPLAKAL
jgi:hypothetical protein